jgi:hypothetical protein
MKYLAMVPCDAGVKTRAVGEKRITPWGTLPDIPPWTPMTNADLGGRGQMVLQAGQKTITVDDVICAAYLRGELETSWHRVLKYGQSETSGLEPGQTDLQVRSEQFRISRGLIAPKRPSDGWMNAV